VRRLYARFERSILLVAGALFAVALVVTYAKSRPAAHEYTQKDIDAAVLHTLETTQLPSFATKAFAAVEPSVVRVMGYGPETADEVDKDASKDGNKDKDKDKDGAKDKSKTPGKDKEKDKDKDKEKEKSKAEAPPKAAEKAESTWSWPFGKKK
jgi:hypothetical protein